MKQHRAPFTALFIGLIGGAMILLAFQFTEGIVSSRLNDLVTHRIFYAPSVTKYPSASLAKDMEPLLIATMIGTALVCTAVFWMVTSARSKGR